MTDVTETIDLRGFLDLCVEMTKKSNQAKNAPPFYYGPMDFVRREGETFTPAPYDRERWRFKGTPRNCFGDAFDLALFSGGALTYVEGYASNTLPAIHHAWCVDADGVVVDPTWASTGSGVGEEYLGVRFPNDYVVDVLAKKGTYGVLDHEPLWEKPLSTTLADYATVVVGEESEGGSR